MCEVFAERQDSARLSIAFQTTSVIADAFGVKEALLLHNPNRLFQPEREGHSPALYARRLRLEFDRLQRRLDDLKAVDNPQNDVALVRREVERIARELRLIRADSVHAVESKLRVVLGLTGETLDETTHKLLASAIADLHYLAVMSGSRVG